MSRSHEPLTRAVDTSLGPRSPGLIYVVDATPRCCDHSTPAVSQHDGPHQTLLTPEEFASLIEIAVTSPDPHILQAHMTKLVALGYAILSTDGPVVTGDGLVRMTKSESSEPAIARSRSAIGDAAACAVSPRPCVAALSGRTRAG